MSWLNQLQNIVSSASRTVEPPPEETVPLGTLDSWDAPPEEKQGRGGGRGFRVAGNLL